MVAKIYKKVIFYAWCYKKVKTMTILVGEKRSLGSFLTLLLMLNGFDVPIKVYPMKIVCGLDIHEDSVFCCILDAEG